MQGSDESEQDNQNFGDSFDNLYADGLRRLWYSSRRGEKTGCGGRIAGISVKGSTDLPGHFSFPLHSAAI